MPQQPYHLSATLLPDGDGRTDLWLADGRLSFRPQPGAVELASAGGYLLAGLVDCHSHLTLGAGPDGPRSGSAELVAAMGTADIAAGVLFLRDIGLVSTESLVLPTRLPFPRFQRAGRLLAPANSHPLAKVIEAGDLAPEAISHITSGAQWVKLVADFWASGTDPSSRPRMQLNYPAAVLSDAVAAVHGAGGRVAVHAFGKEAIKASLAAAVDSLEHAVEMDESLLAAAAAAGTAWTPTLQIFRFAIERQTLAGNPDRAAYIRERLEALPAMLHEATRVGVSVLAGTDNAPGGVPAEVAALHEAGMSPRDALAAATTTARRFLGIAGLEEGAPADIVLYRADPRNDPEVLRQPELVVLGGRVVS